MQSSPQKPHNSPYAGITSQIEYITPQIARDLLAKNTNNRSMNPSTVKYYEKQILNGQWDVNGESIKIAVDGTLLDGQHRLEAISRSNSGIDTFVTRGLPKHVFTTIDNGKSRSHGDYLKIDGIEGNHGLIAAAARISILFKKSGEVVAVRGKLSPEDIVCYVDKHKGLLESVSKLQQKMGKILPSSIAIGCHYVFSIIDMEKADEFFHLLATGEGLFEGSPILTFRNRLLQMRGDGRAGEGHRRMLMYYVVHAFNAYLDGRELRNIPYKTEFQIFLKQFNESCLSNWGE